MFVFAFVFVFVFVFVLMFLSLSACLSMYRIDAGSFRFNSEREFI
jgi:hypothetical protein